MSQDFLFDDSETKSYSPLIAYLMENSVPQMLAVLEDLIELDTNSKWARTKVRLDAIEVIKNAEKAVQEQRHD